MVTIFATSIEDKIIEFQVDTESSVNVIHFKDLQN